MRNARFIFYVWFSFAAICFGVNHLPSKKIGTACSRRLKSQCQHGQTFTTMETQKPQPAQQLRVSCAMLANTSCLPERSVILSCLARLAQAKPLHSTNQTVEWHYTVVRKAQSNANDSSHNGINTHPLNISSASASLWSAKCSPHVRPYNCKHRPGKHRQYVSSNEQRTPHQIRMQATPTPPVACSQV